MINRRNIRIKVMQSLYALLNSTNDWSCADGTKSLSKSIDEGCALGLAYLYITKSVFEYSITDATNRASKRLRSEQDLQVNTKMSGNLVVNILADNTSFEKAIKHHKINQLIEQDFIKRLYTHITGSSEYSTYTETEARNAAEEQKFFLFVLNTLVENDNFNSTLDDHFSNVEDDSVVVCQWIHKNLDSFRKVDFMNVLDDEKRMFGNELLSTFLDKHAYTSDIIRAKLLNWDPERLALLDMIIMQLGLTEILYFETIPCKVSINEYIDIAKAYSTLQSGQFVNGVLDKVYKELEKNNKIHKQPITKK